MHDQQSLPFTTPEPAGELVWPIAAINGRRPSLVRRCALSRPAVELAYARAHEDELATVYPPHTPNGSATHFMPNYAPAFAVHDAVIAYAGKLGETYSLILDHCDGWATFYSQLEHMFATPTARLKARAARVHAGDVLGYIGAANPGAMKCLHFELWRRDDARVFVPVDPTERMRSWRVLPWTDARFRIPDPIPVAA